ncbi:uncharacterized protein TNCV_796271 [Trichonephila clavipes]|nr:uncharacterized protein TNCV_796271 [Trichonephila clavipes]
MTFLRLEVQGEEMVQLAKSGFGTPIRKKKDSPTERVKPTELMTASALASPVKSSVKSLSSGSSPLPPDRVNDCAIFEVVGIDLAGPLFLKTGEKVYQLDPGPYAAGLYSGCTPGKRLAWFLPDDRHSTSIVGLRGGWRHGRMKGCFTLMNPSQLCPGIGGEPKSIKKLRPSDLLIETKFTVHSKSFLLAKHFLDSPLAVFPHKSINSCHGVTSETDFCELLKDLMIRVVTQDEVEKLAYQLNEEAEWTERPIRRLSKVMYGSTCTDMQVDVMGECLSSIKHVVGHRFTTLRQFQTTETAIREFSSGRPRVTTPADDRYIVLQARRNRRQSAGEIAIHTTQATGRPISRFTMARRLHGGGLFARRPVRCVPLTPAHRRRLSLCGAGNTGIERQ